MKISILNLVIILLCISTMSAQDIAWAHFSELRIKENCEGEYVRYNLDIFSPGDGPVEIKYVESNIKSLKLFFKGQEIQKGQSVQVVQPKELKYLNIEFVLNPELSDLKIILEQIKKKQKHLIEIPIKIGHYQVTDFTKEIKISDACLDSIFLDFPFQGTQTDLSISAQRTNGEVLKFATTYYCCSRGNSIKVSRYEKADFKVYVLGCHSSRTISFKTY